MYGSITTYFIYLKYKRILIKLWFETNLRLQTGDIKIQEIKLEKLDLVRTAQQICFGKSNIMRIQNSGFMNALKC